MIAQILLKQIFLKIDNLLINIVSPGGPISPSLQTTPLVGPTPYLEKNVHSSLSKQFLQHFLNAFFKSFLLRNRLKPELWGGDYEFAIINEKTRFYNN